MPAELLTLIASIVEKGGVSGLLLVVLYFTVKHLRKKMDELTKVYRQRDFCRQVRARYKWALEKEGITVKIDDIEAEMKDDDHMDKE